MAEGKKSFIAYIDWKQTFESLPDDKAGQLIKHLFAYVNDENPKTDDVLINAVFANIKQTLKRDLRKYEEIREKRSLAGKASADKRQQVLTSVDMSEQVNPVSDSDNVSVNDNKEKKKAKVYINDHELNYLFLDFLDMRKKIKKPATDRAIQLLLKDLEKIKDKRGAIELSIKKNYQGLFEPNTDRKANPIGDSFVPHYHLPAGDNPR